MHAGYPPKTIQNTQIVSCFITPSQDKDFTSPPELKKELLPVVKSKYLFDFVFRTDNREEINKELFELMSKKFDATEYLTKNKPWDFFIMHEIGFDRLHHAFWKFFDPST